MIIAWHDDQGAGPVPRRSTAEIWRAAIPVTNHAVTVRITEREKRETMISGNGMSHYREWTARAKCAGDDPSRYELGRGDLDLRQDQARALCAGCPVLSECARDALDPLAIGTVRGGVWIPGNNPRGDAWPQARARLAAAGGAR